MLRVAAFLLSITMLVAGCTSVGNDVGVGQDLYSRQTPFDTNNLSSYFRQLCAQARLVGSNSSETCSDYGEIVQTGFNDIDQRCDRYLAWIDFKRTEALRVKSGIASLAFTSATVLTIANVGMDAIGYVAAALGLAVSLYDNYNNSLLIGLESTTIKQIVYQRRLEYRRQFSGLNYQRTPEMVFALRGYLRICTPQTIVLDANTYALSAASGTRSPSLEETVGQEVDALNISAGRKPLSPYSPGNQRVIRQTVKCPECKGLFPDDAGFTSTDVKAVQAGVCVPDDGKPGQGTLAGVENYRQTQGRDRTGPITEAEYSDIVTYGCQPGDLGKGIGNFFEAVSYRDKPDRLKLLVKSLNTVQPASLLDQDATSLTSKALREKIKLARVAYHLKTGDATRDGLMSRDLERRINQAARTASSSAQGAQ
ncbi:hypothetical protein HFN62_09025 [Rhizobium leguminosarum]|uniref:hypothetical protein n=1 Tax=Rhizobium leguminosarum TaxID=384 RepID=UPI001C98B1B1|nr:hypothetical protein [Rhizobium leguminosarum]MBY5783882.1 hypothetical protein [Rhizobium leguminosarum]